VPLEQEFHGKTYSEARRSDAPEALARPTGASLPVPPGSTRGPPALITTTRSVHPRMVRASRGSKGDGGYCLSFCWRPCWLQESLAS
jgi:hypothetical protein